jgi:hypothetical protein
MLKLVARSILMHTNMALLRHDLAGAAGRKLGCRLTVDQCTLAHLIMAALKADRDSVIAMVVGHPQECIAAAHRTDLSYHTMVALEHTEVVRPAAAWTEAVVRAGSMVSMRPLEMVAWVVAIIRACIAMDSEMFGLIVA